MTLGRMRMPSRWTALTWAAIAASIAGAVLLRVYRLGDLPPGLHGDEAAHGLEALRIGREGFIGVWSPVALGQPAGPLCVFALFVNWAPNEIWSVRLGAALLGIAALPVFFLFCRRLLNTRAALIGTVLLGFGLWHIHYSRIAFPVIALPLMEVLALWLLLEALDTKREGWRRWALLVLAGAAFGATVYTYSAFYVFVGIVVAFWMRELMSQSRPWRRTARWAVVFGVAAVVVAAPFLDFAAGYWQPLQERRQVTSVTRLEAYEKLDGVPEQSRFLIKRTAVIGLNLFRKHKFDGADGAGGRPLLDPLTGSLAALGFVVALVRPADRRHFLLLVGLLAGAVGTAFTLDGENRRFLVALPFVFAAAGYAGDRVVAALQGRATRAAIAGVLAAGLAFVVWHNSAAYFRDYVGSRDHRWVFGNELTEFAERYREYEGQPYVYWYSDRWGVGYETLQYLAPGLQGEDRSAAFGTFSVPRGPQEGPVLWVVMPPYQDVLTAAQALEPGGRLDEVRRDGQLVLGMYYVP